MARTKIIILVLPHYIQIDFFKENLHSNTATNEVITTIKTPTFVPLNMPLSSKKK